MFDTQTVRDALETFRQFKPLGSSPLRRLVWVHHPTPLASNAAVEQALAEALTGLIVEGVDEQRAIEGLPPTGEAATRPAYIAALRADFAAPNPMLHGWSALYYRYVLVNLDLPVKGIAAHAGISDRQVQRIIDRGILQLTQRLSTLETQARRQNWDLWLRLKLPRPTTPHLEGVDNLLRDTIDHLTAYAPIVALIGPGGAGKTALARRAASTVLDGGHFDDLAWVTLRWPVAYPDLLRALSVELGYLQLADLADPQLEMAIRARLHDFRTLIVLDSIRFIDEQPAVFDALVGLGGSLLVTGRPPPRTAYPVATVRVPPLRYAPFCRMLERYARRRRTTLTPEQCTAIYNAVGGSPLAGRTIIEQPFPMEEVLASLSALQTQQGESLIRAIYAASWEHLSGAARHTALALLLLDDGALTVEGLRALNVDAGLNELVQHGLIEVIAGSDIYLEPVLRQFLAEVAHNQPEYGRRALDTLDETTSEGAFRFALQLSDHAGFSELAPIVLTAAPFAHRAGQWLIWRDVIKAALAGHPTPEQRGRLLIELGIAERWLGHPDEAYTALQNAADRLGQLNALGDQAIAHLELARLYMLQGLTSPAFDFYQRAAAQAYQHGLTEVRRRAIEGQINIAVQHGRYDQARELLQRAEQLSDEVDGPLLNAMGTVARLTDQVETSIRCHTQALEWFQHNGNIPQQGWTYLRLGLAHHRAGSNKEALAYLTQGIALMQAIGDVYGQGRILANLGSLYSQQEDKRKALTMWQRAADLQAQSGDDIGLAYVLYNLADHMWREKQSGARPILERSRQLAQRYQLTALLASIESHPLVT